jgi:hypothetical protein
MNSERMYLHLEKYASSFNDKSKQGLTDVISPERASCLTCDADGDDHHGALDGEARHGDGRYVRDYHSGNRGVDGHRYGESGDCLAVRNPDERVHRYVHGFG